MFVSFPFSLIVLSSLFSILPSILVLSSSSGQIPPGVIGTMAADLIVLLIGGIGAIVGFIG